MSSIGGLSSTSSSSINGYGGLASGLDRDSLIEGMTIGTQTKIDNANRDLQELKWEQEAFQSVSKELYEFTQKYTSFTSDSNLLSSTLYAMNNIEAIGEYAKYVSVSGASETQNPFDILGVKSLAQNAFATSTNKVSTGVVSTGKLNNSLTSSANISSVVGDTITFKYGEDKYTLKIENEDGLPISDIDSPEEIVNLINKSAEGVELKNGQTLADVINFSASGGKITVTNTDPRGGEIEFYSSTGDALVDLGILAEGESLSDLGEDGAKILTSGFTAKNTADVVKEQTMAEALSGAEIKFEYNSKVYDITLGEFTGGTLADLQAELQNQINTEIGKGRVEVGLSSEGELTFQTITPDGSADATSSFSLAYASNNLLGENGVLGVEAGISNRLNTSKSLAESGFAGYDASLASGAMTIQNADGELIDLTEHGLTWDSSISEIINTINGIDELGIKVDYQKETDKFTITSNYDGAAGEIDLKGTLAQAMFNPSVLKGQEGKDAVVAVQYASGEIVEITRGTNTITSEGMEVTVSGTFGYNEVVNADGTTSLELDTASEAVSFDVAIDTEATTDLVKEFIDEYNKILEMVNTQAKERPDNDYYALTADEKKEMSESEIELWEEEAKKGLLYGDSIMTSLVDDLRFMIPATLRNEFEEMGITVSTNYADNGKLIFDESKFESALKEDPTMVQELLSGEEDSSSLGINGLVTEIKDVMDKYASMSGATKGLLVEKAGSEFAPTSVLENSLLDMIEDMEDEIESLKNTLQMETDRYTKQFTTLETLIAEMNSQSSYLSSIQF